MMKTKIFSMVFAMLILCSSVITVFAAQGTDGDELHVAEAQKLEIQLGTEWAGVEFTLRTDAGVYPDVIPVDENGVLSLEIGGSKTYILSCLQSSVATPELTLLQAPVTSETEPKTNASEKTTENTSAIPLSHIIIFVAGTLAAIGILIAIYISNKHRRFVQDDEDEDEL